MNTIVMFFRDILSGNTYVVVSLICFVLICFCVRLLVKRSIKSRKVKEDYQASHVVIINKNGSEEIVDMTKPSIVGSSNTLMASSLNVSSNITNTNASSVMSTTKTNVNNSSNVVMINPMEVAAISSTMNLIGNEQKKTTTNSSFNTQQSNDNSTDNANNTASLSNPNQ